MRRWVYVRMCVYVSNRVDEKVSNQHSVYTINDAHEVIANIEEIRKSLSSGERQKRELMQVGANYLDTPVCSGKF